MKNLTRTVLCLFFVSGFEGKGAEMEERRKLAQKLTLEIFPEEKQTFS